MKFFLPLFYFIAIASTTAAQIKIDTGYTVVLRGMEDKEASYAYFLPDPARLMIKENASGKTCTPLSMHWTFIIKSEIFQTTSIAEAKKHMLRLTPKDLIFLEKIVMPSGCFPPPKQIEIKI
jgi:hypothetical protein